MRTTIAMRKLIMIPPDSQSKRLTHRWDACVSDCSAIASDVVEAETLSRTVDLFRLFHFTSIHCKHLANAEGPLFSLQITLNLQNEWGNCPKKMSPKGRCVAITTARIRGTAGSDLATDLGLSAQFGRIYKRMRDCKPRVLFSRKKSIRFMCWSTMPAPTNGYRLFCFRGRLDGNPLVSLQCGQQSD